MPRRRPSVPPAASDLDPIDRESGRINVVIEAGRGTRNKYKYDQETHLFALHRVLPSGSTFPLDFGFIPGTEGEDGDPLDILVFSDDPLAVGSVVPSRLLGVIEAEQTQGSKTKRNDRLVAVTAEGQEFVNLQSLKDLPEKKVKAFEAFFVNYNAQRKIQFRVLGARGPARAKELIEQGRKTYRRKRRGR